MVKDNLLLYRKMGMKSNCTYLNHTLVPLLCFTAACVWLLVTDFSLLGFLIVSAICSTNAIRHLCVCRSVHTQILCVCVR